MKRVALVLPLALALVSGGVCLPAYADDVVPQAPSSNRYAGMADRSPFAPPSSGPSIQPAMAPPPGPKWSDELTVTLLTQNGGIYFATIFDKSKKERFLLQSNREDLDRHLALASVQWGDLVDQTTVTLRHNNEFAPVRFDANAAAAAPAAPMMPGRPLPGGTYPAAAGTPAPGHLQPPPAPPGAPGAVRRASMIRATPTVAAPPLQPPSLPLRRPLANREDEDK